MKGHDDHLSDEINTEEEDELVEYDDEDEIDENQETGIADKSQHQETEAIPDDQRSKDNEPVVEMSKPKKRKISLMPKVPKTKLNASTILSDKGFKILLSRIGKFKFKGKGHEVEDLNYLMSFYKDWAHGLYPKFTFQDVIKTIEKKCHSRDLHFWIDTWFAEWKRGTPLDSLSMPGVDYSSLQNDSEPNISSLQNDGQDKQATINTNASQDTDFPLENDPAFESAIASLYDHF